jgi:hypothetical protein
MATFPSLQALSRSYVLPGRASSVYSTDRTRHEITFVHGATPTNPVFTIGFPLIRVADADAISSHYLGQKQHSRFSIPITLWQMHPSLYDLVPANQLYIYNRPPARSYVNGLYDVTIEIMAIL